MMSARKSAVVFLGMLYPHGIIRHLVYLACEMEARRRNESRPFDLFFASTDDDTGQNAWPLVEQAFAPERVIKTGDFAALARTVVRLSEQYDRILVHTGGGWGQTKYFVKALHCLPRDQSRKIKLIATTHSYRHDSIHRLWMSALQCVLYILYYDKIVFQCKDAADRFVGSRLLFWSGKGVIVPLGCEEFHPSKDPLTALHEKSITGMLEDESVFKLVYLAQFRAGKMHTWLVDAIAPVMRAHKETRLLLCGMGDSKVIDDVKRAVARNHLDSQVLLPGQIPRYEVPWLLQHVNCALVPSRAETFGHNFIEPMFARLPVIGTRVGIGKEVIEDGVTGFGFSLRHPQEFRNAVERVVTNPLSAKEMGENAYARVATTFRHGDVAKLLTGLYEEMLDEWR